MLLGAFQQTHGREELNVPALLETHSAFAVEINMSESIHSLLQSRGQSSESNVFTNAFR